ncbi:MAG TPA: STAS/SEC14 domain-containing protein [Thermohalobaculum sp.]|nr:STAS/SEC14 domain-containing protein [Thermohalobaculum sp.]
MLEHEMLIEKGILIARPNGPLTGEDFAALSADADAYIEAHGALNGLVICAEVFPGWETLGGFFSHFKFVRDHHRKILKVAFVSDSNALAILPNIANHFVSAAVKHFKGDDEQQALTWIGLPANPDTPSVLGDE